MEMQGRRDEGIDLLEKHERYFTGGNNVIHHLWWHRAMFHLEQGEFDAVLGLYDRRFRNLASPLTQALPDLYLDVQNAASMLFRHGIDVGDRSQRGASSAQRSEPQGSHNARRNYDRYLALAQAELQAGDKVGAENYYQHAEHYFRSLSSDQGTT
jgi:hypothetical protein